MKSSALLLSLLVFSACAMAQDESVIEENQESVEDVIVPEDSDETIGIYVSGFEASALHPCDEPGEQWWMGMNAEFSERYSAMIDPATESRGSRGPYVLVRVEGDKTELGQYGHLGAYSREFTVTDLVYMHRIDTGPEGDVAEWVASVCEEGF